MVTRVVIPDQLYLGLKLPIYSDLPEGIITAYGGIDFVRRKAVIDKWTLFGGAFGIHAVGGFVIDNALLSGFTVIPGPAYERRLFVRDPRGFDVAFPCDKMTKLICQAVVQNGRIIGRCRYAKQSKGGNILLLEGTPEYDDALLYTELQTTHLSIRELWPGNMVYFKNGLLTQYLGYHYPIYLGCSADDEDGFVIMNPQHHFLTFENGQPNAMHICRNAHLSKIINRDVLTPDAIETIIQQSAHRNVMTYDRRVNRPYNYFASVSHPITKDNLSFSLEPTDVHQVVNQNQPNYAVIGLYGDRYWRVSAHSISRMFNKNFTSVDGQQVDPQVLLQTGIFRYHSSNISVIKHLSLPIATTSWNFVKVTISNPHTGSSISVRLR